MLLNSDLKTAIGADDRQRAESLSCAGRKHGLLGIKKLEGMMKERLASRDCCRLCWEGGAGGEILQKHTSKGCRTHANALSHSRTLGVQGFIN